MFQDGAASVRRVRRFADVVQAGRGAPESRHRDPRAESPAAPPLGAGLAQGIMSISRGQCSNGH